MKQGSLTLVPSGGLANRMRAVVSACQLCKQTGSTLQVVWFRDWALNAAFHDIFEPIDPSLLSLREAQPMDFFVYDRPRRRNLWLPRLPQMLLYERRIHETMVTPLKLRSFDFAAWLQGHRCHMSCYQEFGEVDNDLYAKLFRPVRQVREQVEELRSQFSAYTIGMHIRRTDNAESIAQSPLERFIDRGREELRLHPDLKIFLATDNEDVKREMRAAFGQRIITATAPASRSSADGIRGGLIDMYALAATQHLYGSVGSSFAVAAARIGRVPYDEVRRP